MKLNSAGMAQLLKSDQVREMLMPHAERVLAAAKENAPVRTGAYRDSIHIEQATTDRAVVRVVASAPHAHLVEANTGNLARALDAG